MSDLSVTMIVRDAEKTLERALASLTPLAPQIIILDTGSKDKTLEIAKSYTNFVFQKPWKDDFSWARNETLQYVANPWIMYLDSDEWLDKEAPAGILSIINDKNPKNFFHSFELHQGPMRLPQVRLWYKSTQAVWERPVHEQLTTNSKIEYHPQIIVHHQGKLTTESATRNIKILNKALETNPNDPLTHFYLALEYNVLGNFSESIKHAMRFIVTDTNQLLGRKMYIKYVLAWTYTWKIEDYNAAVKHCVEALAANCCLPEFWCTLGDVFLRTQQPLKAKVFYRNAIFFGKYHPKGMWVRDLEKADQYPKWRILQCEAKSRVQLNATTHPEYFGPIIPSD